jgi:hypothetical protein
MYRKPKKTLGARRAPSHDYIIVYSRFSASKSYHLWLACQGALYRKVKNILFSKKTVFYYKMRKCTEYTPCLSPQHSSTEVLFFGTRLNLGARGKRSLHQITLAPFSKPPGGGVCPSIILFQNLGEYYLQRSLPRNVCPRKWPVR